MAPERTHEGDPAAGDAAAAVAFFRAHVRDVHRYVSRLTGGDRERTEDLVQEVFVRLARAQAAGRPVASHPGWLLTTARHVFLHDDRHARREHRRLTLVGGWRPSGAAGADAQLVADAVPVRDAVARLADHERAALVFRYVDDLPVAEVAALLGRSVEATESLLVRARRRLRRELGEEA